MATPEETARAQQQMAVAQHEKTVNDITELGRETYGSEAFDDAANIVGTKMGDRVHEFVEVIQHFDAPHKLVVDLANDERSLEDLAKLPTARLVTEVARREARMSSDHARTGNTPNWRHPSARTSTMSDADWSKGLGANLSDADFHRIADKKMAERSARLFGTFKKPSGH